MGGITCADDVAEVVIKSNNTRFVTDGSSLQARSQIVKFVYSSLYYHVSGMLLALTKMVQVCAKHRRIDSEPYHF